MHDMSPNELAQFWRAQLERARDKKPAEAEEEEPPSVQAFMGKYWSDSDRPKIHASVNIVFAALKGFLPQILAKTPVPEARARRGNQPYAHALNALKDYREGEFGMRAEYRKAIQDTMLRGTGFLRVERDIKRGLARSCYFPVGRVYWDDNATCPQDAAHVIEAHECYRWEFASRFGHELAEKIPTEKGGVPESEEHKGEHGWSKNFADRVKYYLAWSKHDGERRVYAFHESWADDYLTVSEDGLPGEPWPWAFDEEEWHISQLALNTRNECPYGFSFYTSAEGPIRYLQWMASYVLAAAKKSATQTIVAPRSMQKLIQRVADAREHLEFVFYDDAVMDGKVADKIEVIQYPQLAAAMMQGEALAWNNFDKVTGFNNAIAQNASGIETAAESVRMEQQAEVRLADDQRSVEEWLETIWRKEIAVDAKHTPKRSVVQVVGEFEAEEEPEGAVPYTRERMVGGEVLTDVPYAEAILLERGVGDVEQAQQELQAYQVAMMKFQMAAAQTQATYQAVAMQAQAQGMMPPPPPQLQPPQLDPAIAVRVNRQVPLEADCQIIEPGVEAFVGEQLAAGWVENMSDREIKSEVEIRVEQGSTRQLGHMQRWNEAMQMHKATMPIYLQWGAYEQAAAMHNHLIDSLERKEFDDTKISGDQLRQFMMQQQQMMQQQAQQETESKAKKIDAETEAKMRGHNQRIQSFIDMQAKKDAMAVKKEEDREQRRRVRKFEEKVMDDLAKTANQVAL
jgi:hypothetical protein